MRGILDKVTRDLAREAGSRALRSAVWYGKRICGLYRARFGVGSGFAGFAERDLAQKADLRALRSVIWRRKRICGNFFEGLKKFAYLQ